MVTRMTRALDRTGVLPATDWQSIATLGPELIVVVEKPRAHVERTLDDFDESKPVQDRAEQQVIDDAFDLLATQVAQDGALYRRATTVLETY